MPDRCKQVLYVKLSIKVPKCSIVELSTIVSDNDTGKSELIDDRFSKEILDFAFGDMLQGFCLHPFGKVVDGDNENLSLAGCWEKLIKYVHSPLDEGLGGRELSQLTSWLLLDTGIALALIVLQNKLHGIYSHSRPVVSLPSSFVGQNLSLKLLP